MKINLENQTYNTRLVASDWRYSASIVGLIKYFHFFKIKFSGYNNDEDYIEYNQEDIREDLYLQFVENYFRKDMHHCSIEAILEKEEPSEEEIQSVNEKLSANSIMKKVFKGLKYSAENKAEILKRISEHRQELIRETYKHRHYAKFSNRNLFFKEPKKICRLNGYYVDTGRKTKSISYMFDDRTFVGTDEKEFDFIPFAFTQSYEALFVNNNFTIRQLVETNRKMQQVTEKGNSLFAQIKQAADFINYDVEVISKSQDKNYFETRYIRKHSIAIIQGIERYSLIQFKLKTSENLFIDIEQEVINRILNNLILDDLIELLLKEDSSYHLRIHQLIKINIALYGGENMDDEMKSAYASAKQVNARIPNNKANSYKQKLINAIIAHDYDRVCEILLQLSSYSGVVFNFAYDLFEDFERNKNIAYTFINALNTPNKEDGEKANEKK